MEFHPVVEDRTTPVQLDCPDSVKVGAHRAVLDSAWALQKKSMMANPNPLPPSPSNFYLTAEQIEEFHSKGALLIRREQIWTDDELKMMIKSVEMMDSWPETPGKWMKYFEKNLDKNGNRMIQRIENFNLWNPGLDYIQNGSKLLTATSQLLFEPAILYKEKINYKLPGGEGFTPHQDVAAGWWLYKQTIHLSVLVSIDPATIANGCLEVAWGQHNRGMLSEPWKELSKDVESSLKFDYVETRPGDVVFFDSYIPHRSAANNTDTPRRVLYATYAKKSEGDFRDRYYADKRQSFPPDCERIPGKKYEYKV